MRKILSINLAILALVAALPAARAAVPITRFDMRVGPPPEHHNLGNHGPATISWLERSVAFPSDGYVMLQAFADSQNSDRLELLIDGTTTKTMSGAQRSGQLIATVAAGTHTIRIQYNKDGMVDEGLDTVWVDNVRMISSNHVFERYSFSDASGCDIPGWTRGGYGGGWCATLGAEHREMRRPLAMAYAGYQGASSTSAGIKRNITWPATSTNNELRVGYFVDSEESHDFFRVIVDGVVVFQDSGRRKLGTAKIPVTSGSHLVQLEYLKDDSGDEGFDEARVLSVEARSAGGIFQMAGADGLDVGDDVSGWTQTSSDASLNWDVVRPRPPLVIVEPDTVVRTIDGQLHNSEYGQVATMKLPYRLDAKDYEIVVRFATSGTGSVVLGIEFGDAIADLFSAGGKVTLLADSSVLAGLVDATCTAAGMLPGPNSRKIEISRDAGGAVATTQQVGQCDSANPWKTATQVEQWPIAVAVAKHTDEPPAYGIELQLDPARPSGVAVNGPMAVLLRIDVADKGLIARIPWTGSQVPNELDPSTWEELWLGPTDLEPQPVIAAAVDARPKK
jgi:hypothetical protein